ncbi:MAG: class I SAM-dependent methyltransferase [Alphaproteobacteria bacterium]|nr:class I SAM-dependent methyltransferase [Alphaproteobacteria bacterium]
MAKAGARRRTEPRAEAVRTGSAGEAAASEAVDFGFRKVARGDKARLVREVFDSVARRYDAMNDLMSLGLHRRWKEALVDALDPREPLLVLDVAGGTADVARRVLARAPAGSRVTVCDINAAMLAEGRDRSADRGRIAGLDYVCGDAEALPLADRSVDAVTVAFGLRNMTDIPRALAEMRRVLRPGGRFFCLEFSRLALPGLERAYDWWSFEVLPEIGARVARDREAYVYLAESIRKFPDQERLLALMQAAGFERTGYDNLAGGIVAIHQGWRI